MSISSELSTGYCTIRLVTDERRGTTIPVGVVAWDSRQEWFHLRTLDRKEAPEAVPLALWSFVSIAQDQLLSWAENASVPYAHGELPAWTSAFWSAAGEIMTTAVRLDPPKAMEPIASRDEFELLFEALVQPKVRKDEAYKRLDGALTNALGPLAKRTSARMAVPAFGSTLEPVMRGVKGTSGVLVIEAVNLAGRYARRDADAVVSKILRIREAGGDRVKVVIGYRASPGGLNGELHMKEWISAKATEHVYDLNRETDRIRAATAAALEAITMQESLALNVG